MGFLGRCERYKKWEDEVTLLSVQVLIRVVCGLEWDAFVMSYIPRFMCLIKHFGPHL